jgi:Phospholipid methyltransferase
MGRKRSRNAGPALEGKHKPLAFYGLGLQALSYLVVFLPIGAAARMVQGHRLVTEGPYRYVRHPIYAGMLGMLIGTGVVSAHWPALVAATLIFMVGTWVRIKYEEALLHAHLFKPGDCAFGMQTPFGSMGGYAQYVAMAERALARKPECISHKETAAAPCAALTAHRALVEMARIGSGSQVLIVGASGGVGSYAVQIAKAFGATVTESLASCRSVLARGGRYLTTIPSGPFKAAFQGPRLNPPRAPEHGLRPQCLASRKRICSPTGCIVKSIISCASRPSGVVMLSISKLPSNIAIASLISSRARKRPGQIRGPAPKGIDACLSAPLNQRCGSNAAALGKVRSSTP